MEVTMMQDPAAEGRLDIVTELGIESHAQPIVDLFTGEIFGYEMLARGRGEFADPQVLFAKAAEWDLSSEVEKSCRIAALRKIKSVNDNLRQKYFFINISPRTLGGSAFQEGFTISSVRSFGLDHSQIVLEITENESVGDYEHFENVTRHYMSQGFNIALDDFGSGHSGLITLVTVTPDFMKIDKAIVRDIDQSGYKQKLLKAISRFADEVGSKLIAEGVETWKELKTVFRLGIRYVQGFLLGKPAEYPAPLPVGIVNELKSLIAENRHHHYSVDISATGLVTYPRVIQTGSMTCSQLDEVFKRNRSISHFVILLDNKPTGLITREHFFSIMSGRYGYSVYAAAYVEQVAKVDILIAQDSMDLRILSRLAMGRDQDDLYDPAVLINGEGELTGTITMHQLLLSAFDTEINLAVSANPLTKLPGNMIIGDWINTMLLQKRYSVIYVDLDRFKEFNDCYGYATGDDMIKFVATFLSEYASHSIEKPKVGHIGGDDFILVADSIVDEQSINDLCSRFDREKLVFFSREDIDRGYYITVNRKGAAVESPLVTLSVAIITSDNFTVSPHPGRLAQIVAHLKKEVKRINEETEKSGYLYDRRSHG